MLTHVRNNIGLHAAGGVYTMANSLPWGVGEISMLNGASPAVVNGDLMFSPPVTTPDGYALQMTSTGVPLVFANGDTAGQRFAFDVYDISLRQWYGAVTEYMNDHAPLMLDTQPHNIVLIRNVAIAIDLTSFVVDQESDPLVVTTSDAPPPGMIFDTNPLSATFNNLTGTPDTPGSYAMHFTATDPAGGSVVYPLFTFTVGNEIAALIDQTITIFKVKAGPQGPSGGGTDGITINLTKNAFSLLCYADGNPIDPTFAGCDGYATVFKGALDDTATATLSATGTGLTGTVNTAADTPVLGQPKGYYRVTGMTASNATLNITAVDSGATLTRQFSVSKTLAGIEIVNALPISNLFNGRIVFLTSDGKLYRYVTGTGWTSLIPAGDISGQITSTQISDNAITTPKLSANSVTAANIAANAVTSNQILAGAITAAKVAASSVITATAQIGDLIVTSIKIADNAITNAAQVSTEAFLSFPVDNSLGVTNDVWFDLNACSLSFTSAGGRLTILTRVEIPQDSGTLAALGDYIQCRLVRDSFTVIGNVVTLRAHNWPSSYSGFDSYWNGVFTDNPASGAHVYKIQVLCHSIHALASFCYMYGRGLQIREDIK